MQSATMPVIREDVVTCIRGQTREGMDTIIRSFFCLGSQQWIASVMTLLLGPAAVHLANAMQNVSGWVIVPASSLCDSDTFPDWDVLPLLQSAAASAIPSSVFLILQIVGPLACADRCSWLLLF